MCTPCIWCIALLSCVFCTWFYFEWCTSFPNFLSWLLSECFLKNVKQVLTTDTLVLVTMKNAARRDMYCELQNSVIHQIFERILRFKFLEACLVQCHVHFPKMNVILRDIVLYVEWHQFKIWELYQMKFLCWIEWVVYEAVLYSLHHWHIFFIWEYNYRWTSICYDLSKVKLPAELKHTSKRRKRN